MSPVCMRTASGRRWNTTRDACSAVQPRRRLAVQPRRRLAVRPRRPRLMARWKRFRPGPDDTLVVSLAPEEMTLLSQLPSELRDVFDAPSSDPAAARLFP